MTDAPAARFGAVARLLHWGTVVALVTQFVIGYTMDAGGQARGRGRGRSGESGRGRGRGRGGEYDPFGDDALLTVHVVLGVAIIVMTVVRWWWRKRAGLPPWASGYSAFERRLAHVTERALYALLVVVPATGIALVLGGDDLVALHVAGHIALYVALAAHVGLVLKHQLIDRDRLLRRML